MILKFKFILFLAKQERKNTKISGLLYSILKIDYCLDLKEFLIAYRIKFLLSQLLVLNFMTAKLLIFYLHFYVETSSLFYHFYLRFPTIG